MKGSEIELASQCLILFIKSIPENCFFNIIRFGKTYRPLFDSSVAYTEENVQTALKFALSLEANLGGTVLSLPLKYVFSKPPVRRNKQRRVYILTDGRVSDPKNVIGLVRKNASSTMCSAIGIGYAVDRKLIQGIGDAGNGFIDFVLSGDDMRCKVIEQLSRSLNGLCQLDISCEKNENIEIVRPLSMLKLSQNEPITFYIKATKRISKNSHISIKVDGNQIVMKMKAFSSKSRASKSLEYLFNNENLKYLRNKEQTKDVQRKITELSIEYGILSPYIRLVGVQEFASEAEKERITKLIEKLKRQPILEETEDEPPETKQTSDDSQKTLYISYFLRNDKFEIKYKDNDCVEDLKSMIQNERGIPISQQRLVYAGKEMGNDQTLGKYQIKPGADVFLIVRHDIPKQNIYIKTNDGENVMVECYPNERVESVKAKLEAKLGIPSSEQTKHTSIPHFLPYGGNFFLSWREKKR